MIEEEQVVDIVLLDFGFPGQNRHGVEIAMEVRRLRPDLPVIFFTSGIHRDLDSLNEIGQAFQAGHGPGGALSKTRLHDTSFLELFVPYLLPEEERDNVLRIVFEEPLAKAIAPTQDGRKSSVRGFWEAMYAGTTLQTGRLSNQFVAHFLTALTYDPDSPVYEWDYTNVRLAEGTFSCFSSNPAVERERINAKFRLGNSSAVRTIVEAGNHSPKRYRVEVFDQVIIERPDHPRMVVRRTGSEIEFLDGRSLQLVVKERRHAGQR